VYGELAAGDGPWDAERQSRENLALVEVSAVRARKGQQRRLVALEK
jgi:hypothetical protein